MSLRFWTGRGKAMWIPRNLLRRVLVACRLVERPALSGRYIHRHPSPDDLQEGEVLVVRDAALEKWACFKCPGGCGEKIMLSLSKKKRPHWAVQLDWLGRPC